MRLLRRPNRLLRLATLAAAAFVAACASPAQPRHTGLFTSLPILWQETGNLGDLLKADAPQHWALAVLQKESAVQPLDSLLPGSDGSPIKHIDWLVMAQPRPLAPQENVALDDWVRSGGRLLLFADPMLTAQSAFAIGDRRRPEDIVMLSPILARWGLRLEFDEDQPAGERRVPLLGTELPVNLHGRLVAQGKFCNPLAEGLAAQCRIGKGRALILADAALLEPATPGDIDMRRDALERLLAALAAS